MAYILIFQTKTFTGGVVVVVIVVKNQVITHKISLYQYKIKISWVLCLTGISHLTNCNSH